MAFPSVLLAEDDPIQRMSVRRMLESEISVNIIEASNGAEALQYIQNHSKAPLALAFIDLGMPQIDGIALLKHIRTLSLQFPCIVLTGSESVEDAVEAMRLGAVDFITKPTERERLIASARNALALQNLQGEMLRLQRDPLASYSFDEIAEVSPSLKDVITLGRKAAGSDIPILLTGESGVGKEVFARAIYAESKRLGKAFVPLNCGALPDNLVESILFGHEKGAFTGAVARSIGKCREADGGVLFLDEVGELKPDTQVKLLRMLQQGEIEPVGSSKSFKIDVRVISATNRPLEQLVQQGLFREDLYYRLQGLPLHISALRERRPDITSLANYLLKRIAITEQRLHIRLSANATDWLIQHDWPGNVRELQHTLHRATLLASTDIIEVEDLSRWIQQSVRNIEAPLPPRSASSRTLVLDGPDGQPKSLDQIEREVIEMTMQRYDSHIGKTAAALSIGQSTLYKRLNR